MQCIIYKDLNNWQTFWTYIHPSRDRNCDKEKGAATLRMITHILEEEDYHQRHWVWDLSPMSELLEQEVQLGTLDYYSAPSQSPQIINVIITRMSRPIHRDVDLVWHVPWVAWTTLSCSAAHLVEILIDWGKLLPKKIWNCLLVDRRQPSRCNACTLEEFQNTLPQKLTGSRNPFCGMSNNLFKS